MIVDELSNQPDVRGEPLDAVGEEGPEDGRGSRPGEGCRVPEPLDARGPLPMGCIESPVESCGRVRADIPVVIFERDRVLGLRRGGLTP